MLNSTVSSSCIQVGITNDLMIESQENFIITLRQGAIEVEFVNDTATIAVIDNDRKIQIIIEHLCATINILYFSLVNAYCSAHMLVISGNNKLEHTYLVISIH